MIGVVHSNLYDLLGRWSWMVFVLGLSLSIVNILASNRKFDLSLSTRLRVARGCGYIFLVITIWMVGKSLPIAYSGPDPFNDVHIWMYDKHLAAAMALIFTLAFAVEEELLRYRIKKIERELEAQMVPPTTSA